MDSVEKSEVIEMVKRGYSYERISEILKIKYPSITRGLSGRSVRRCCKEHDIKKLDGDEIDEIVVHAVGEVCVFINTTH